MLCRDLQAVQTMCDETGIWLRNWGKSKLLEQFNEMVIILQVHRIQK
jgi:hypothetical protein